jgi:hypothetical protein
MPKIKNIEERIRLESDSDVHLEVEFEIEWLEADLAWPRACWSLGA